jgi:hypothetical protein
MRHSVEVSPTIRKTTTVHHIFLAPYLALLGKPEKGLCHGHFLPQNNVATLFPNGFTITTLRIVNRNVTTDKPMVNSCKPMVNVFTIIYQ